MPKSQQAVESMNQRRCKVEGEPGDKIIYEVYPSGEQVEYHLAHQSKSGLSFTYYPVDEVTGKAIDLPMTEGGRKVQKTLRLNLFKSAEEMAKIKEAAKRAAKSL